MSITRVETRSGAAVWVGRIDRIRVYLRDLNGAVDPAQAAVAERLSQSLATVRAAAEAYLDLFVDRRKACGGADERWWLDEIEFRDHAGTDPVCYALHFTLQGDDGGQWTVDMRDVASEQRPFRFERSQG